MLKDQLSETSVWQFGPEEISGLSRNGPQPREENSENEVWFGYQVCCHSQVTEVLQVSIVSQESKSMSIVENGCYLAR